MYSSFPSDRFSSIPPQSNSTSPLGMLRNDQIMEDWRMPRDPSFSQEFCRFPNTSRQHGLPPRYPSPSRESWRNVGHRSGSLERQQIQLNSWASQDQLGSWNRMVMGERLHAGFGGVPGPLERELYAPYNTHRDEDWVRSREYSIGGERSHSPQRKSLYGGRSHLNADWVVNEHIGSPIDNEVISLPNPTGKSIQEFEEEELEKAAQMQIAMMAELEKNCGESDRSNTIEITLSKEIEELTKREVEDVEDNFQLTKRQIEDVDNIFVSPSKEFLAELGFESSDDVYHAPASEIKDDKPKVIADAKFEDIHFSHLKGKKQDAVSLAAPRRIGPSLPYSGDSWAEQYKSQVNRRKMEIRGGNVSTQYNPHLSATSRGTVSASVYLSRVGPTVCGTPANIRALSAHGEPIKYIKHSESMLEDDCDHQDKCQQEHSQSREHETIIDPKEFIEELSDSEDWNEVVALVNTPVPLKSSPQSLKRSVPSDNCGNSERPFKRGLLGGPPLNVLPPTHLSRVNRTNLSNHPASHHKPHDVSFFRMDLPSVVPKIAFENPKNVCDDTSIRSLDNEQGPYENNRGALKIDSDDFNTRLIHGNCPPQSRIAPAISRGRQFRTDRFDQCNFEHNQNEECDISSGAGWRHQGFSRRSSNWARSSHEAWRKRTPGPSDVGSFFR